MWQPCSLAAAWCSGGVVKECGRDGLFVLQQHLPNNRHRSRHAGDGPDGVLVAGVLARPRAGARLHAAAGPHRHCVSVHY